MKTRRSAVEVEIVVKTIRLRSLEHRYESEAALDQGDLERFQEKRSLSHLEREVADELDAETEGTT
ncbi:MAG TPA: hypothetical protein VFF73_14455 [Planctomycetota bacterium]|nr:hypothetical protein [Planctomycetota bacterium]